MRATDRILVTVLVVLSVVGLGMAQSRRHVERTSRLICVLSMHDSEQLRDADDADEADEIEDQPITAPRQAQKIKPLQRKTVAAMPALRWLLIAKAVTLLSTSAPRIEPVGLRLTLLDLGCALRT